ncbi:MAG: ABC transporter ATP-binding protein [candidate division WOR-3 bacterium]
MGKEIVIEFENISKKFGNITALKEVSFKVEKGIIFGIFGPNGAGKTTTIRIIAGILKPDSGRVYIRSANLSYIPEELSLYKEEKVLNILKYILSLKKVPQKRWKEEIEIWSSLLKIEEFLKRRTNELSKGQKRKVMFAMSLLGNPEIIIMDEPFIGLDVEASEGLKKIAYDMKEKGKTIIFSTHILELAEELCEEVIILKNGEIIERGGMEELRNKYTRGNWVIRYSGKIDKTVFPGNEVEILDNIIKLPSDISLNYLIEKLEGMVEIMEIKKEYPNFKEIYLRILGEKDERDLQL